MELLKLNNLYVTEEELIQSYKNDFKKKTNKGLRCSITSLIESDTDLMLNEDINIYAIVDIILRETNWLIGTIMNSSKSDLVLFRRGVILYILYINGVSVEKLARTFKRDRSTLSRQLNNFTFILDNDYDKRLIYTDVLNKVRNRYDSNKTFTLQQFRDKYE